MKKISFSILLSTIILVASAQSPLKEMESKRVHLPNGWSLTPVGKSLPLGDLPLNIVVSPTKKYIAATNNGQSIHAVPHDDNSSNRFPLPLPLGYSFPDIGPERDISQISHQHRGAIFGSNRYRLQIATVAIENVRAERNRASHPGERFEDAAAVEELLVSTSRQLPVLAELIAP